MQEKEKKADLEGSAEDAEFDKRHGDTGDLMVKGRGNRGPEWSWMIWLFDRACDDGSLSLQVEPHLPRRHRSVEILPRPLPVPLFSYINNRRNPSTPQNTSTHHASHVRRSTAQFDKRMSHLWSSCRHSDPPSEIMALSPPLLTQTRWSR